MWKAVCFAEKLWNSEVFRLRVEETSNNLVAKTVAFNVEFYWQSH